MTNTNRLFSGVYEAQNIFIMNIKSMLSLFLIFSSISVFAQQKNISVLSTEAKRHWNNAMIYKEEAKNFSENELVINELEKLVAIQDYPDAYLELGKLYGKGYVSSWINRSQECFKKYIELCPDKKNIADEENDKCEAFRNIRKKRFENKLVGKWVTDFGIKFGDNVYCFEVNDNGTVIVPSEYSEYMGRVTDWQTINFDYWPNYGEYILSTGQYSGAFKVRYFSDDGEVENIYIHISFFYKENDENPSNDELIGYINHAWENTSWIWNENHKVVYKKIR